MNTRFLKHLSFSTEEASNRRLQKTIFWIAMYKLCILILSLFTASKTGKVKSYEGSSWSEHLECSAIKISSAVGCVCVTGLWKLYDDCSSSVFIAGNSHCLNTQESTTTKRVQYALEVLPNMKSIAIVQSDSNVIKIPCHGDFKPRTYHLTSSDLIVSGSPHTLKGSDSSACINPRPQSYCFYNVTEFIGKKISRVTMGCRGGLPMLPSTKCFAVKDKKSCDAVPGYEISIKDEDEPASDAAEKILESGVLIRKKRSRRKHMPLRTFGRTFLGAPGQELDNKVDEVDPEDEDYIPTEELANITATNTDTVLSEIWNTIENQAEVVMGFRNENMSEIHYNMPHFKLLHAAKRVMQKACPKAYVPPKFFDIAVQTFIQVLMKRYAYELPNANLPGFDRIMKALENCAEKIKPFPFITPETGGNASCNDSMWGSGQFDAFNQTIELNVTKSYVGLDRDPMIETTWKVFDAAVAFCYPFFDVSSYNDHHRFIAWILPLFQQDILTIWLNGSSTNLTYGQFLGDMENVMSRIAYCTASARFTGLNVTYPWELSRPGNKTTPEEGGGGDTPPDGRRRKRSFSTPLTECMEPQATRECFAKVELSFVNLRPVHGVTADNLIIQNVYR